MYRWRSRDRTESAKLRQEWRRLPASNDVGLAAMQFLNRLSPVISSPAEGVRASWHAILQVIGLSCGRG